MNKEISTNMKRLFLILIILFLFIQTTNAYQWNDFPVNNPFLSGNNIVDHNNFTYSSNTDGIYKIDYGNGKSTFFGFALSGTVGTTNFVKFTSDYTWSNNIIQNGNTIDVSLKNNDSNWITNFSFTPYSTKITNTLTNTLPVSITNAKFYYVFTVSENDIVLYNNINYTIPSHPNIHLSGDLTNNIPSIKINRNMIFNFQDIVDNGFIVTDLYLQSASSLGINYNGNIVAIGFTKNGGIFPSGATVLIDPEFSNGGFEDGVGSWSFAGNGSFAIVSPAYEGTNMAQVSLDGTGLGDQLYTNGFTLEPYTNYRLSLVANSTLGNNINFQVIKHTSPYTVYGLQEVNVNLTTSMARYAYNFTTIGFASTTTDTRLSLYIASYADNTEKYYFDSITLERVVTPPSPTNLTATQGNFWINHTWTAGTGNTTDSYNVSVNGSWANGTALFNNVTVEPHGWSNITVYAHNQSAYNGTMNTTGTSLNTQLDNNPVTIGNISVTYTIPIGGLLQIIPSSLDLDSDTLTFATDADKGNFTSSNGSLEWTPQAGDNGTYNWYINVTDSYGSIDTFNFSVSVESNTPGIPTDINSVTGNFNVNTTWNTSVNIDLFNISFNNGSYLNGSALNYINLTLSPHAWSNITVWGYNSSYDLLGESANLSTQIPNNVPTIESTSISSLSITTAESLTISAINVTDLDNDNITVNVSILFNLGGTINYSMTQTANTSNWTKVYSSVTAGAYTVTSIDITDNNSATTSTNPSYGFTITAPVVPATTSNNNNGGGGGGSTANTNNTTFLVSNTTWKISPSEKIDVPIIVTGNDRVWDYTLISNVGLSSSTSNKIKSEIEDSVKLRLYYNINSSSDNIIVDEVIVKNIYGEVKIVSVTLHLYNIGINIPELGSFEILNIPISESLLLNKYIGGFINSIFNVEGNIIVGIKATALYSIFGLLTFGIIFVYFYSHDMKFKRFIK